MFPSALLQFYRHQPFRYFSLIFMPVALCCRPKKYFIRFIQITKKICHSYERCTPHINRNG